MKSKDISIKRRMTVSYLAERLRNEIKRQRLAPGTPIYSNRRICELFGVSPMTSTRAVNHLVAEGLLYCIKGSGSYVKGTSNAESKKVGVAFFMPSTQNHEETEVAYGILRNAVVKRLRSCNSEVFYLSHSDLNSQTIAPKVLKQLDAAVVTHSCIDSDTIRQFNAWGKPVVLVQLDRAIDLPYHQVLPDLFHGFTEAAILLRSAGIKHLAILSDGSKTLVRRNAIFLRAAKMAGFDLGEIRVTFMNREIGDSGRLLGYRAGLKLIKEKKIDAIFSPSDFISFGLVDAYRKNGIKLGKDILLISYDNLEGDGLLPFGKAILTTVANPRHEIGRIAADLAQSKSSGAEIGNTHIIRVKTNLIRRQTA